MGYHYHRLFGIMKNQYFGDINDYRKYGLLRTLAGGGKLRTTICWMLTPDDHRTDGLLTSYLEDPAQWRHFDPELFDILNSCISQPNNRSVNWAEANQVIPAANYYSQTLHSQENVRRQYFNKLWDVATGQDLVFFDPDNEIEVKSVPPGTKRSNKYVYWNELADAFARGHSVLVYQHFIRLRHEIFIRQKIDHIYEQMPASLMLAFSTAQVLFLLIPQLEQEKYLKEKAAEIREKWVTQIQVELFRRA